MFFYSKKDTVLDNWSGPWLCGYVFDGVVHTETGAGKDPGSGFGGYVEVVDLHSKGRGDMHFYGPVGSPEILDLTHSGLYHPATRAFYAPVGPGDNVIGMHRFWDRINNYNLFTTLQNDSMAQDYHTIGYQDCGIRFYIFKPEFGPQPGIVPLFRFQHGLR